MVRTERFYKIDQMIHDRRIVSFVDLMTTLEVSRATLKRDLEYMRNRLNAPIIWDRWTATNPHALIIAESGSGKTYAVSGLITQELALEQDAVLILDPKFQEYRQLVTALGGADALC